MDDFILAKFPDDDRVLGPFLGNLPPEILDVVVEHLGWFQTTFAMAGRTCREAVERAPTARAVLTQRERKDLPREMMPLAVASAEGDVEALEWLIQLFDGKGPEWRQYDYGGELSLLAAGRGKIAILAFLCARGYKLHVSACAYAAQGGHLEALEWARRNGCPWDEHTCLVAAEGGHLEVLRWARRNGCPWDERACTHAASGGHLEVLQWLHQHGCPWDSGTCAFAAHGGHLEVLRWARQNGCEWDKLTCMTAAKGGHLEALKWARENGCPWDEETWADGRSGCRPYLIEHGCPGAP